MMQGTITGQKGSKPELEKMGIEVLSVYPLNDKEEEYTCKVSDKAFESLDPLWGNYIWTLKEE